jgi:hypothetical protein
MLEQEDALGALEELGDPLTDLAEEEAEEQLEGAVEEFDSDNLLARWNRKTAGGSPGNSKRRAAAAPKGPTIQELINRFESQIKSQFGEHAELVRVPMDRVRATLRELFPPRSAAKPSAKEHAALQGDLHLALNQVEDILDSLVLSTRVGA